MHLVALYRAGLSDDARTFADKHQLSALLQKLEASRLAPLATSGRHPFRRTMIC
jgi:hypothetical protein